MSENQQNNNSQSTENENINNGNVENVEESTNSTTENVDNVEEEKEVVLDEISVIQKDEFDARLKEAIEKHLPENGISDKREAQIFINYIARQIGNYFPKTPTLQIVSRLGLMFEGKYQNDAMLQLIEEMPVGGYGY